MKAYYGSRFPVINILTSKILFGVVKYRLSYLRFRNKLKQKAIEKELVLVNDSNTKNEFDSFIKAGYDKVNIGGGPYNINGFVNIDFVKYPEIKNQLQANILDLSFIDNKSLSHIYSNQVLEHLSYEQLISQFNQYNRILKEDGVISFRTPNALGVSYGFWFGQVPEEDGEEFIKAGYPSDAFFYDPRDGWYHKDLFALIHWWYADAGNIKNKHLTLFTPTKVKDILLKTGFEIVCITKPETSQIIVVAKKQQ